MRKRERECGERESDTWYLVTELSAKIAVYVACNFVEGEERKEGKWRKYPAADF